MNYETTHVGGEVALSREIVAKHVVCSRYLGEGLLCWWQGRRRVNRRVAAVEIWAWVHGPGSLADSVLTK